LFIAPSLLRFGATRRNDADHLDAVVIVPNGMSHQEQEVAFHQTQSLPAVFAAWGGVVSLTGLSRTPAWARHRPACKNTHTYAYFSERRACNRVAQKLMQLVWDESKRRQNLVKHGLDFRDAAQVLRGPLVLFEDDRQAYGEQRFVGIGLLRSIVVVIVHTERDGTFRIISMRKAERDEEDLYFQQLGYG
jgi:hypothetical protein